LPSSFPEDAEARCMPSDRAPDSRDAHDSARTKALPVWQLVAESRSGRLADELATSRHGVGMLGAQLVESGGECCGQLVRTSALRYRRRAPHDGGCGGRGPGEKHERAAL